MELEKRERGAAGVGKKQKKAAQNKTTPGRPRRKARARARHGLSQQDQKNGKRERLDNRPTVTGPNEGGNVDIGKGTPKGHDIRETRGPALDKVFMRGRGVSDKGGGGGYERPKTKPMKTTARSQRMTAKLRRTQSAKKIMSVTEAINARGYTWLTERGAGRNVNNCIGACPRGADTSEAWAFWVIQGKNGGGARFLSTFMKKQTRVMGEVPAEQN